MGSQNFFSVCDKGGVLIKAGIGKTFKGSKSEKSIKKMFFKFHGWGNFKRKTMSPIFITQPRIHIYMDIQRYLHSCT